SIVMKSVVMFTGALQVTPLSVDLANPTLFAYPDRVPGKRAHAMYALGEPLPANRTDEPCPSGKDAATTRRGENTVTPDSPLSEVPHDFATPPGATDVTVKFDQQSMYRLVSGSTSASSLSAKSTGLPFTSTKPLGFVAGVTSKGPLHVWPQSVERWIESVPTT